MMSLFRSMTKTKDVPDAFEELYQRSPVPKIHMLAVNNTNASPVPKTVPLSSFPLHKSKIFHQLKEKSQLNTSRSPFAFNTSHVLSDSSIHNQSDWRDDHSRPDPTLPAPKRGVKGFNNNASSVAHYFDDDIVSESWQNGTFSDDIVDKSVARQHDEVDGDLSKCSASVYQNNDTPLVSKTLSESTHDSVPVVHFRSPYKGNKQSFKSPTAQSQSVVSVFNKMKMMSSNENCQEDQENCEPDPCYENNCQSKQQSQYPIDVEVSVPAGNKGVLSRDETAHSENSVTSGKNIAVEENSNSCTRNKGREPTSEPTQAHNYKLYSWIIKPLPEVSGICVDGKLNKTDEEFFHSSVITERISKRVVLTANGSKYTLMGNMDKLAALDAGITEDVVKAFVAGFPVNWEFTITKFFSKVKFVDEPEESTTQFLQLEPTTETVLTPRTLKEIEMIDRVHDEANKQKARKVKEYTLTDWIIKPISGTESICVEGKKCDKDSDEYWHSTAIDHIKDKRTLVTNSGSIYKLQGKISKLDTLEAGFSKRVVNAFTHGFPRSWKSLIKGHFNDVQKQKNEDNFLTPKARCPDNGTLSSTVCTPEGVVYELDKLKKSRSGRIVKPALAWWSGQRVKLNHDNTFELTYNSANTPEMLKAMSAPIKTITPKYKAYLSKTLPVSLDDEKTANDSMKKGRKFKANKSLLTVSKDVKNHGTKSLGNGKKEKQAEHKLVKQLKRSGSSKQNSNNEQNSDLDSLVEELTNTVKKAKSFKKSDKKDTCYSKQGKSREDKSTEDTYSVDNDSDFDGDEPVKNHKRKKTHKEQESTGNKKKMSNDRKASQINSNDKKTASSKRSKDTGVAKRTKRSTKEDSKADVVKRSKNSSKEERDVDGSKRTLRTRSKSLSNKIKNCSKDDDSLPSSSESSDEDEFSKKTGTVKSNRTQSRITKPTQNEETREGDLPWTKQEILLLKKAVAEIPSDEPLFWEHVAQKVKTRNDEQCIAYYYKDDPKSNQAKKTVSETVKKAEFKGITAKKGTLKRKKQLKELIERHNEGYEDDLFDSTPYRRQGSLKMPKLMADDDEDIFEEMSKKHPHLLNRIYTPLTRIHIDPVSEKKTPATSLESPWTNVDRKDADQYIHQIQKRRHLKGRNILDKTKTPVNKKQKTVISPTKNLFGTKNLFVNDEGSSDNYEDSDNEIDYYWSDENS